MRRRPEMPQVGARSMTNQVKRLERAACAAHRDGVTWGQFWPTVAEKVRRAEPWDVDAETEAAT